MDYIKLMMTPWQNLYSSDLFKITVLRMCYFSLKILSPHLQLTLCHPG